MINRYIPYGYYIENAQIKVNEVEADIIREMFHKYIAGSSLKGLAEALTQAGIEYLPGKNAWDQNRVYRLLCSNKYAGENGFPPIVTADDYRRAQEIRDEKGQGQKGPEYLMTITEAVAPILCGACGQPAVRHRGRAGKGRQRFVCGNPDCAAEYCITDEKMTELVLHLMRGAEIQTPEPGKTTLEIRKTENEIERLLEAPDADPKEIRCRIFDLAAEKYRLLTAGLAIADKLRTDLAPTNLSSSNIRKTVMETVRQITLLDDKTIQITLINDQTLGEVQASGTSTAADIRAGDPAHHSSGAGAEIA